MTNTKALDEKQMYVQTCARILSFHFLHYKRIYGNSFSFIKVISIPRDECYLESFTIPPYCRVDRLHCRVAISWNQARLVPPNSRRGTTPMHIDLNGDSVVECEHNTVVLLDHPSLQKCILQIKERWRERNK